MATVTEHLLLASHPVYQRPMSSSPSSSRFFSSPEQSPTSSLPTTAASSTSSVDQLPPALGSEESRLSPCDDFVNMMPHRSETALEDEEASEDHDTISQPPPFNEIHSRSPSPSSPRQLRLTPSTTMDSGVPNRFDTEPSVPSISTSASASAITSIFSAPAPPNHGNHPEHNHTSSPFSFFANSTALHSEYQQQSSAYVKTLKIDVPRKELVLLTGRTTVLKGTLYLNLRKNTKVKSLQLEFTGRSSVTWVDENTYSPATRHTTAPHIEHTWPFISRQHKRPPTVLQAGQHAFPFSLDLPDTLPESLTTTHGKVAYRLQATLVKPGLTFTSSTASTTIRLLRRHPAPSPSSRDFQREGRAVNAAEDKIKYNIAFPQIRLTHAAKIPLQVTVTSPNSRITVNMLQVGLWERVVYRAEGRRRVDMRLVKIQKSEGWPHDLGDGVPIEESVTWNKVLLFDMPTMGNETAQCNPSTDNGLIKVSHILRFSILGADGTKRFRVENEVNLHVLAFADEYDEYHNPTDELPSYLTSFTTPRVSFDSERELDPTDDDLLQALVSRIHLPTYVESEEDTNSRNTSRNVSRSVSQAPSRGTSPERSLSNGIHESAYSSQRPGY
ncbi:hypothetical protein BG011_009178 [Mortierella polycephala]|uniref:Arrestin C-terminal-like domain-containing protein n=1 Tax=Mortierella polycephala TaxID=41804 RepID=A0A9P6U6X7_9FUNG|nr:hypothetical protein BG011_009178 [Mortierella polycephala]